MAAVTLRPLTVADAPAMVAALDDPESMRLTGTVGTFTLAQVTAHLARCETDDARHDFAILAGDEVVGEVVLNHIDAHNACANFRIAVWYPRNRGRGYGFAATVQALDFAFDVLELNRVELEVYAFNPRARHVYEKAGFVYEGTRREALLWDGEWVDAHGMGALRRDREK